MLLYRDAAVMCTARSELDCEHSTDVGMTACHSIAVATLLEPLIEQIRKSEQAQVTIPSQTHHACVEATIGF